MADQTKATNITWHQAEINREDRERLNDHRACTLWFTGLSGSGKSTLALAVESALFERGCRTFVLDGDNIRHGLNKNLGFSPDDRKENIRRIGEVAKLFTEAGVINMTAFISPYREDRELARSVATKDRFFEIHVHADLDVCEQRDPKGLYKKARAGEIKEFTGVDAPYEAPEHPELFVDTGRDSLEVCTDKVLKLLQSRNIING